MLEIIIMIGVVRAFSRTAEQKNLSKILWGIIGAASFYVPVFLVGSLIFPELVMSGIIKITSEGTYMVASIIASLIVGALCCFIAYNFLKNMKSNIPETDDNILDDWRR